MKLEIHQAIHLILALPAHRSNNEAHRELGMKALDELLEYKQPGGDETEKAYNKAMIGAVLSAARAFSVERDRIKGVWESIDAVKKRRERLLVLFQNLSPFTKDNYWSKAIAIVAAAGWSVKENLSEWAALANDAVLNLILALIGLEVVSKLSEYLLAWLFENRLPLEKERRWKEESMATYKRIVGMFIADVLRVHQKFYPDVTEVAGREITTDEGLTNLTKDLTDGCFYC